MSYPTVILTVIRDQLCRGAFMIVTALEPSAAAVAGEVRRRKPGIGKVKLHKLLYYVQGYHLAWEGCPAFTEDIEAWEMGPVVAGLWSDEKYFFSRESPELQRMRKALSLVRDDSRFVPDPPGALADLMSNTRQDNHLAVAPMASQRAFAHRGVHRAYPAGRGGRPHADPVRATSGDRSSRPG